MTAWRRNKSPGQSWASLMTSELDQSSNQDYQEFQVVMGKSGQPSWLPPFINKILQLVVTSNSPSTANRHLRRLLLEPRTKAASTSELCSLVLSVDYSAPVPIKEGDALFLSIKAGMTVIVKHLPEIGLPERSEEWWMADVDSGVVRWVNADLVTHIVPSV